MKGDAELQRDVMDELRWEPSINAAEIGVAVKDGVVTLSGHVENFYEKWVAERAVLRVSGVMAVAEELEVRLTASNERTDEDIARSVLNSLEWHTLVPHNRVKVMVEHGRITLEGEVDYQYQKRIADEAVHHLTGVKAVVNRITVKPKVKPAKVKEEIKKALERNALLDAQNIQVEARGDKVILRGSVRSWAERQDAESAAWAAPGVSDVDNRIKMLYD